MDLTEYALGPYSHGEDMWLEHEPCQRTIYEGGVVSLSELLTVANQHRWECPANQRREHG